MAVNAATIWEIRASATGGTNVNGGGFNPSNAAGNTTDYSQQNGAQYGFANLASSNGTTNPSVVTSASHNFVTADVGNFICISAGTNWTQGWYEIVSVAANAATLDRAVGSAASLTNGTFNVGGAITLGGTAANRTDANFFNTAAPGNTFYIANGSYVLGASTTITTAGTASAPVNIIGYNTSRTDAPLGSTRPSFSNGAFVLTLANFWHMSFVMMTSTASTQTLMAGGDSNIISCKLNQTSASATRFAFRANGRCTVRNCEFLSSSATDGGGIALSAAGHAFFYGNWIHSSVYGASITGSTSSSTWIDNIFDSCSSKGINLTTSTASHLFYGNTFFGAETPAGTGIDMATGVSSVRLINNIFYGWTTAVQHADTQSNSMDEYNAYNNNTTDVTRWTKGSTDVTSNPTFTASASSDFSIGTNLKGIGFPALISQSGSTAYPDIGAVKRKEKTSTDPGIANVKNGTAYTINDANLTGTLVVIRRNPNLDGI